MVNLMIVLMVVLVVILIYVLAVVLIIASIVVLNTLIVVAQAFMDENRSISLGLPSLVLATARYSGVMQTGLFFTLKTIHIVWPKPCWNVGDNQIRYPTLRLCTLLLPHALRPLAPPTSWFAL